MKESLSPPAVVKEDAASLEAIAKRVSGREKKDRSSRLDHAKKQAADVYAARQMCKRGEWGPWCEKAGLSPQQGRKYAAFGKTLVTSGFSSLTEDQQWAEWQRIEGNASEDSEEDNEDAASAESNGQAVEKPPVNGGFSTDVVPQNGTAPAQRSREPGEDDPDEESPSIESSTSPPPKSPTDEIGLPVPEAIRHVFEARGLFNEAMSLYRALTKKLNEIALIDDVSAWRLRKDLKRFEREEGKPYFRSSDLEGVKRLIEAWTPHVAMCPRCLRDHDGVPQEECTSCLGKGWVPTGIWKNCPKEDRERVERMVKKQ